MHRLGFAQNAKPAERIFAIKQAQDLRDARAGNAVKAVAAGDEIAFELLRRAVLLEMNLRLFALDIGERNVTRLEQDRRAVLQPARDHVLDYFLLAIDRDPAADELAEIEMMQP